ncbi:MAG: hypothetical protein F6K09_23455 [Merismopedia sp. SIO2A8]|nr:hypothetical protein [Merismopedia sp. SIO2A8]
MAYYLAGLVLKRSQRKSSTPSPSPRFWLVIQRNKAFFGEDLNPLKGACQTVVTGNGGGLYTLITSSIMAS